MLWNKFCPVEKKFKILKLELNLGQNILCWLPNGKKDLFLSRFFFSFQGRVPWNLAGLVGHLQPDSGPGLSHYSPHYLPPNSGGGHNPHLLPHPGSGHEQSSLWGAMGMHPGLGPPVSGDGPSDPIGLTYKSIADPMSMYYPATQVRNCDFMKMDFVSVFRK